ncbi:Lon protease family protein [Arhodomonas sp. AD133]|uniref:Lon protease family protein n=1 Tax=Arhodomonas sp. AD133 TaxID=3415009 RepID=UPI003EBDEDF2
MARPEPLTADAVYHGCDPERFDFATTDELEALETIVGQDRAIDALRFGASIRSQGFNLYVLGPPGIGKHEVVERFLRNRASDEPVPPDCCYLHNFDRPNAPRLIQLPAGDGERLRADLEQLIEELRTSIPATFESDEYHNRLRELHQAFGERQQNAFREIHDEAEKHNIALLQTPGGFTFAPRDDKGEVMESERFRELPEDKRKEIEAIIERLQAQLQEVIQQLPRWRKETQEKIRALNEEMAVFAVGHRMAEFRETWRDYPRVREHLDAIQRHVTSNVESVVGQDGQGGETAEALFRRYHVNVLVSNGDRQGAPVIYEDNPGHQRLVGRVEHHVQQGALVTDFRLIEPGALHRANGGYLVLDVRKLLFQPLAWETLKRALYSRSVKTESLEQLYSLMSTVSLEPEPVPLDVKVVLLGDRLLYYLLAAHDPDFLELFKVQADFEEDLARNDDILPVYARMIATVARNTTRRPLDRDGVARVIEQASRLADDGERLTTHNRTIADLLTEADYWAAEADSEHIGAAHIQQAIEAQTHRASRVRDQVGRAIHRGTLLIDSEGEAVGSVNGLSVLQLGGHAFGRPTRITANARLGRGHMVDIEREAKLGGSIHTKGMMILSSLLASRYARERQLSLAASVAFEQSYGTVDGDSASVAEFCALCSVLAEVPLRQSIAVTGSLNQHGQVQAVGGVNEKIEGFFDVCAERGLTGEQGVALPAANVAHLMLRADVVEAVRDGRFRIWPLTHVDEALELLTGLPAGTRRDDGTFEADSVNARVEQRLQHFSELAHGRSGNGDEDNGGSRDDNGQD